MIGIDSNKFKGNKVQVNSVESNYVLSKFYQIIILVILNIIICLIVKLRGMDWVGNLCNCFSPELRRNIIGYLSASNLNRQVIEQQKCTQQIQQNDQESIYQHAKQKSYYTIQGQDFQHIQKQNKTAQNQLQFQNQLQPHWYPQHGKMSYDEIFQHKLKALKLILATQIDEQYQKVYDSQDQNSLVIYAKNQLEKGKTINLYRFHFNVPNSDEPSRPKDFLSLQTINEQGRSLVESLLKNKQVIKKTDKQLQICYRTYEKKLVISQHDFVTAQKKIIEEQLNEEQSSQGKQVYNDIVYALAFSVKGAKDQKSVVYNRGNINLCGLKAHIQTKQKKNQTNQQGTICYKQLKFQGYINIQLDTTVNSNMLRQPVAKQVRMYAQKLICLLQKSDAI